MQDRDPPPGASVSKSTMKTPLISAYVSLEPQEGKQGQGEKALVLKTRDRESIPGFSSV